MVRSGGADTNVNFIDAQFHCFRYVKFICTINHRSASSSGFHIETILGTYLHSTSQCRLECTTDRPSTVVCT